ncbi:MAG: DNA sulfur modification protein DndE [Pseudomonadaceae bacterium]
MIDRVRLTASAKNQLIALKRKTGISHYNSLCRIALCVSLASKGEPPFEDFDYSGGLEIDWRVFNGNNDELYFNMLALDLVRRSLEVVEDNVKATLASHVHRGLSYLASKDESELCRYLHFF